MNRTSRRSIKVTCSRCGERVLSAKAAGWNVTMKAGRPVGHICPNCQTPEEDAEAKINDATIDYGRARLNAFGQMFAPAKLGDDDD